MQPSKETFLDLVCLGIGHRRNLSSNQIDWQKIYGLATHQELLGVVIDGIERLQCDKRPPQKILLEWIGEVLQGYEYRYESYKNTIAEMAGFYNSHGYKMMILKGYACSLNWPKPEHRPCGDIDIWQFGEYQKADAVLEKEKGIKVDHSHHHHTVFNWKEFSVENHYDFNNVHHHKSSAELENIFKELGKDDTYVTEVLGEKVYLPSPNLHTLFLLKHSMTDFAAFYVTLRQVLDWGFHVKHHYKEIDWDWLLGIIEKYHMKDFFNTINAICIDDLGFSCDIFPKAQFNPSLKEKVLDDILNPKFTREEPSFIISRLIFKLRRWAGNVWKHKLCYNESLWSGFWSEVWAHLLKPASI